MSSFADLLNEEREFQEDRALASSVANEQDDPIALRAVGAAMGRFTLPPVLSNQLSRGFGDYVAAPLAAGVRYIARDVVIPDRSIRFRRRNGLPSRKPSAITTSDGFKITQLDKPMSFNFQSTVAKRIRARNKRRSAQRQSLFQSGAPPNGTLRNINGKNMVWDVDGWYPIVEKNARGQEFIYSPQAGAWMGPSPSGPHNSYGAGGGRFAQGRKPRSQRAPARQQKPRSRTIGHVPGRQTMNQSGLKITGVERKGDNYNQVKHTRYVGDDLTVMNLRMYTGNIGYTTAGKITWTPASTGGTDTGGQFYFNPTLAAYVPSASGQALLQTARRYRKFKVVKGAMHFSPLVSGFSNPDIRVAAMITRSVDDIVAFKTTPGNFVGSPATPTAQDTVTREIIMAHPDSCATTGWAEKGFSCPIPPTPWLYNFSPDSSTSSSDVVDFSNSWAAYRQSLAFLFALNISGTVGGATLNILECFMDITIHFKGLSVGGSVAISVVSKTELERKLDLLIDLYRRSELRLESKAQDAEDPLDEFQRVPSPTPSEGKRSIFKLNSQPIKSASNKSTKSSSKD